jgi:hypothetical protein
MVRPMSAESGKRSTSESKADDVMDPEQKLEEWRTLARVLDRLFFIIYMIISPIITVIYFGILVSQH